MRTFLVESYAPRSRLSDIRRGIGRLAVVAAGEQVDDARYLRSILVLDDEVCFHLFRARSEADVRRVTERARISVDRISEAAEEAG